MSKKFNIHKDLLANRPLSWSALSSFDYDPEQWYQNYFKGNKGEPSAEMLFGKKFADSCEARKPLAPVTLLSKMEQPFEFHFNDIPIIGYADTFEEETKDHTGEYKTGVKAWDQNRVDNHGQIKMYALGNFILNKMKPEKCRFFLEWIPTERRGDYTIALKKPVKVHHFETRCTTMDILKFGKYINSTVKEMELYVRNHA